MIYSLTILGGVKMFQGEYARTTAMAEEALALCRELGYEWETATVLGLLAWTAQYRGEFGRAEALCAESLSIFRNLGDTWGVASVLSHLGNVTWRQGRYEGAKQLLEESAAAAQAAGESERAARFLGAAAALRETIGVPLPSADRSDRDHVLAAARAALGDERFIAAMARGRAMMLNQVLEYALEGHAQSPA